MRRIGILGLALVAVVAFSAMSVASASAKKVVQLSTKAGPLATNAKISDFSSNLITAAEGKALECEESTINWTLKENPAAKLSGLSEEDIETGNFEGKPGACKTSLGPADVTAGGFPWAITLLNSGKGEIKGSAPKTDVKFTAKWVAPSPAAGIECTFEATKVKFAYNLGGPVKLTVAKAKFKAPKGGNALCPKKGELSGEFNMTSGGEAVEATIANI